MPWPPFPEGTNPMTDITLEQRAEPMPCLVLKYGYGCCPECRAGFPQWCRGRGGLPKKNRRKKA